ncbi:MAG: endonuclease/exonuclease/phosphatase family protein [Patescibacteria group bacterium]
MKVVSLNTWGGKAGTEGILTFLKKYGDVDVFCLQEIFNGGEEFRGMPAARFALDTFDPRLLERIAEALPNHIYHFKPHFEEVFGLALFVRKDHAIETEGEVSIYRHKGYYSADNIGDQHRIMQYASLADPACTVMNVHGLWNGQGKRDSDHRLAQSDNILAYTNALTQPYVLLGDFNLRPETESIRKLEAAGMRNLVTEYGIVSTRTSLYDSLAEEPHADYAFVSEGIDVKDFKVLPDEISDHAALYLEFDLP